MPAERKEVLERITAWKNAFVRVNGREAPTVDYHRGWYYVEGRGNPYGMKWRERQIEAATACLTARIDQGSGK